tara:strand:+ start:226 stop:783 length:558 start_codon:yes stop_codon:yes gene_type:complete
MIKLTNILKEIDEGYKSIKKHKVSSSNYIPRDHARTDNVVRVKNYMSAPGVTSNKSLTKTPKQVTHIREYEDTNDWIDRQVKRTLGLLGKFRCKRESAALKDDPVFLKNDWNCVANEIYGLDYDDLSEKDQLIVRKTWEKQSKELGLDEIGNPFMKLGASFVSSIVKGMNNGVSQGNNMGNKMMK